MAYAGAKYKEVRFIIEDELTQAYVFIEAIGDCPIGVQGWHHKTFPISTSILDIIRNIPNDDPILWSLEAPKERS